MLFPYSCHNTSCTMKTIATVVAFLVVWVILFSYKLDLNVTRTTVFGVKSSRSRISKADNVLRRNLRLATQAWIERNQEPTDCAGARKLLCVVQFRCGFACQVHCLGICLFVALGTNRTMVTRMEVPRFSRGKLDSYLVPVSEACRDFATAEEDAVEWQGNGPNEVTKNEMVKVTIRDKETPRAKASRSTLFAPGTIPSELSTALHSVHENPQIWWVGQVLTHLTRMQPSFRDSLTRAEKILGFSHPIAGLHIRRTDKLKKEAEYHAVEEYMLHVEEWFDNYHLLANVSRKVFVATDEPTVIQELLTKYPSYEFLYNDSVVANAFSMERYHEQGLSGIVTDLHFLTRCDFVVCTFTSNVGRLVYEVMQHSDDDASRKVVSVDRASRKTKYTYNGGVRDFCFGEQRTANDTSASELLCDDLEAPYAGIWPPPTSSVIPPATTN